MQNNGLFESFLKTKAIKINKTTNNFYVNDSLKKIIEEQSNSPSHRNKSYIHLNMNSGSDQAIQFFSDKS